MLKRKRSRAYQEQMGRGLMKTGDLFTGLKLEISEQRSNSTAHLRTKK